MTWQPMESAPKDKRILVYNPVAGSWTSEYLDGNWPLYYWGWKGDWYPVPICWMPVPEPDKKTADDFFEHGLSAAEAR